MRATTSPRSSSAGDIDGDGLLDPGEIWLYRAFGTASSAPYANIGTVMATRRATMARGRRHARTTWARPGSASSKHVNGDGREHGAWPAAAGRHAADLHVRVHGDSAVPLAGRVVRDDNGTPGADRATTSTPRLRRAATPTATELLDFGEIWRFTSRVPQASPSRCRSGHGATVAVGDRDERPACPSPTTDVAYVTGQPTELTIVKAVNAIDRRTRSRTRTRTPHRAATWSPARTVMWTYAVSSRASSAVREASPSRTTTGGVAPARSTAGFNSATSTATACSIRRDWLYRATGTVAAGSTRTSGTVTANDARSAPR